MPEKNSTLTKKGLFRFSRFFHEFIKEGVVALYHSLTHEVIFVSEEVWRRLKSLLSTGTVEAIINDSELYRILTELQKKRILLSGGKEEEQDLEKLKKRFLGLPSFGILYLLLTDQCNFRCGYCYIESEIPEGYKFSMMAENIAKEGIDLFQRCLLKNPPHLSPKPPMIIFYGGEPLLNIRTFTFALSYIRELQERGEFPDTLQKLLITNGSRITESIGKLIKSHNARISVSLDGWQEINDFYRIDRKGSGTFSKALRGISILQSLEIPVSISVTITPENLDHLVEVFEWLIQTIKAESVGFNLLVKYQSLGFSEKEYKEYIEIAARKLIECFKIGREVGIYEDRMGRRVKSFTQGYIHLKDCGGYGNQIVISPRGEIGVCQGFCSSKKYFPGNVRDKKFDPFKDPIFIEWSQRSPLNFSECINCPALGICGGSCAYEADSNYGTIWKMNENFCILPRMVIEWLIWDLYSQTQHT